MSLVSKSKVNLRDNCITRHRKDKSKTLRYSSNTSILQWSQSTSPGNKAEHIHYYYLCLSLNINFKITKVVGRVPPYTVNNNVCLLLTAQKWRPKILHEKNSTKISTRLESTRR